MSKQENNQLLDLVNAWFVKIPQMVADAFNAASTNDGITLIAKHAKQSQVHDEASLVEGLELHFLNRLYYIGQTPALDDPNKNLHRVIDDLQSDIGKIHAASAISTEAFYDAVNSYLKKYETKSSVVNTKAGTIAQGKRANLLHRYNPDAGTVQNEVIKIRQGLEAFRKNALNGNR